MAIGSIDTQGHSREVVVADNLAFLADSSNGLRVIDVSNPYSLTELGFYDDSEAAMGVAVLSSDHVLVANGFSGLRVIDVTNPANPFSASQFSAMGFAQSVDAIGNIAYVVDKNEGLRIIDVSNPLAPSQLGFHPLPNEAWDVEVSGQLAYVTVSWYGLMVIDVSNPVDPVERGYYMAGHEAVAQSGNLAFVSDQSRWVDVIDVEEPGAPIRIARIPAAGDSRGITIAGCATAIAEFWAGVSIVQPCGALFCDQFESGSTSGWSNSVP